MTPEVELLRRRVAALEARLVARESSVDDGLLAAVLETSVAAVCVLDPEGQIVYANSVAEKILGLVPSAILQRRYDAPEWKTTDVDGGPWPDEKQPFRRVIDTGEPVFDVRHGIEWPDGQRKLLSINGAPIKDASGAIRRLVFSVADITERVQIEDQIRERSDWLRMALGAAQMGIWSWDIESGVVRWSDGMAALFGMPAGRFEGTYEGYLKLIHPDDRRSIVDTVTATILSDASTYAIEHRFIHPDGSVHWIEGRGRVLRDDSGRATGITGTAMDVTKRKVAELALRASEAAFRTVVETVPSYIVSIRPDRKVQYINRTLPHLSVDDVIGVDVLEFLAEESRDEYAAALQRAFETGEPQELEGEALTPGGEPASFLMRMGPVKKGAVVESVTVAGVDITQLKRTEQALHESQEQLRVAQRLESVGRLAGGVAHDFNNLLTVVNGCADLLEGRLPPESELREFVQPIRDAAGRGASLTRQLLAFARRQVVRPRVVDLNERVRDAAGLLGRLIGEDVELQMKLSPDLWLVEIDPVQLEQVLVNLAINAQDAMPRGGRLTIESRNLSVGAAGTGGDAGERPDREGDWVELAVRDTGVGIDAEELPFIFEPFFTTKPIGEGTGLGLATCFGIIRQAGGHIDVESTSTGAVFRVLLPRSEATSPEPRSVDGAREVLEGSGTILLVEDDAAVRRVTRAMLARAGYQLLEAENGEQARELYRSHGQRVDLLVTDVVMPRMSGTALARELLELDPGLNVLFVSGYSTELGSLKHLDNPRIHVLQKPYSTRDLAAKMRQIGMPLAGAPVG